MGAVLGQKDVISRHFGGFGQNFLSKIFPISTPTTFWVEIFTMKDVKGVECE